MNVVSDTQDALASIELHARRKPEFPAVIEPGSLENPRGIEFSYQQLNDAAASIANHLRAAGISSKDVVAVLLPQGALVMIAVAGVVRHACCAPLNPNLTPTEIESHLIGMQAAAILLTPEFEEARQIALRLGIVVLLARKQDSGYTWQTEPPPATAIMPASIALEMPPDTAVLLNTSATTGVSKLVPLTRANIAAMAESTRTALALTDSDRLLLVTALYHAQGIVSSFAQFLAGGAIIATPGFEAASYPAWLDELRPTWYTCAPAIHQAVATLMERRPLKQPVSLRFVRSSGAAFTVELARNLSRLLGIPVLNGYGMSETGAITSDSLTLRPYKPGSVGRSVGPEIGILHPSGALLPSGEEGEIVVRGPAIMRGYANNPEANQTAFREGWFRTGDLGHLDADGFLFITGRSKEMINRGGQKIVPDEVDLVLAAHPAIREAVAFAVPHPTLGEDIACAVIPQAGARTSEAELRRFAGQRLAPFKVPRRIYFVEEIPRSETGKPRRHLLAERIMRKPDPAVLASLTQTAVEDQPLSLADLESTPNGRRLIEIWSRILGRDEIDPAEDFFTAGGDSLEAVNLLAEIDLRFGSDVQSEAASFLDNPTLTRTAQLLSASAYKAAPASSEIEIFPVGSAARDASTHFFCIPADGDEGLYFRRLAHYLEGHLALSVIRPVNTWHEVSLYAIEVAARRTVAALQQLQPNGPYLLGGYCYGGIIAFAAAHLLRAQGHAVRLVLFDVPMPGYPSPLRNPGPFAIRAASEWHQLRRKSGVANPALNLRRLIRRAMWFAMLPARPILARFAATSAVQFALKQAQQGYLPFCSLKPLDAPILHFLSQDERRPIRGASRLGWRKMAGSGMTERWVPLDHDRHFKESNLRQIADAITAWCSPAATTATANSAQEEPQFVNA